MGDTLSEEHLLWGAGKHCKKYCQILLISMERSVATVVFHNILRKPVAPVRTCINSTQISTLLSFIPVRLE